MKFKTEKKKQSAERKAFRAMDAIQSIVDNGHHSRNTDKAMEEIRNVINEVNSAEIGK